MNVYDFSFEPWALSAFHEPETENNPDQIPPSLGIQHPSPEKFQQQTLGKLWLKTKQCGIANTAFLSFDTSEHCLAFTWIALKISTLGLIPCQRPHIHSQSSKHKWLKASLSTWHCIHTDFGDFSEYQTCQCRCQA